MNAGRIFLNILLIFLMLMLIYNFNYFSADVSEAGIAVLDGTSALKFRIMDLFAVTVILSVFSYTLFLKSDKYRYNSIMTDYMSASPVLSYSGGLLALLFFVIGLGTAVSGKDMYSSGAAVLLISYGYLSGSMSASGRKENKSKYYLLFLGLMLSLLAAGSAGLYYMNNFFGDFYGGYSSGDLPSANVTYLIKNLIIILASMKVCEIYEYMLNI